MIKLKYCSTILVCVLLLAIPFAYPVEYSSLPTKNSPVILGSWGKVSRFSSSSASSVKTSLFFSLDDAKNLLDSDKLDEAKALLGDNAAGSSPSLNTINSSSLPEIKPYLNCTAIDQDGIKIDSTKFFPTSIPAFHFARGVATLDIIVQLKSSNTNVKIIGSGFDIRSASVPREDFININNFKDVKNSIVHSNDNSMFTYSLKFPSTNQTNNTNYNYLYTPLRLSVDYTLNGVEKSLSTNCTSVVKISRNNPLEDALRTNANTTDALQKQLGDMMTYLSDAQKQSESKCKEYQDQISSGNDAIKNGFSQKKTTFVSELDARSNSLNASIAACVKSEDPDACCNKVALCATSDKAFSCTECKEKVLGNISFMKDYFSSYPDDFDSFPRYARWVSNIAKVKLSSADSCNASVLAILKGRGIEWSNFGLEEDRQILLGDCSVMVDSFSVVDNLEKESNAYCYRVYCPSVPSLDGHSGLKPEDLNNRGYVDPFVEPLINRGIFKLANAPLSEILGDKIPKLVVRNPFTDYLSGLINMGSDPSLPGPSSSSLIPPALPSPSAATDAGNALSGNVVGVPQGSSSESSSSDSSSFYSSEYIQGLNNAIKDRGKTDPAHYNENGEYIGGRNKVGNFVYADDGTLLGEEIDCGGGGGSGPQIDVGPPQVVQPTPTPTPKPPADQTNLPTYSTGSAAAMPDIPDNLPSNIDASLVKSKLGSVPSDVSGFDSNQFSSFASTFTSTPLEDYRNPCYFYSPSDSSSDACKNEYSRVWSGSCTAFDDEKLWSIATSSMNATFEGESQGSVLCNDSFGNSMGKDFFSYYHKDVNPSYYTVCYSNVYDKLLRVACMKMDNLPKDPPNELKEFLYTSPPPTALGTQKAKADGSPDCPMDSASSEVPSVVESAAKDVTKFQGDVVSDPSAKDPSTESSTGSSSSASSPPAGTTVTTYTETTTYSGSDAGSDVPSSGSGPVGYCKTKTNNETKNESVGNKDIPSDAPLEDSSTLTEESSSKDNKVHPPVSPPDSSSETAAPSAGSAVSPSIIPPDTPPTPSDTTTSETTSPGDTESIDGSKSPDVSNSTPTSPKTEEDKGIPLYPGWKCSSDNSYAEISFKDKLDKSSWKYDSNGTLSVSVGGAWLNTGWRVGLSTSGKDMKNQWGYVYHGNNFRRVINKLVYQESSGGKWVVATLLPDDVIYNNGDSSNNSGPSSSYLFVVPTVLRSEVFLMADYNKAWESSWQNITSELIWQLFYSPYVKHYYTDLDPFVKRRVVSQINDNRTYVIYPSANLFRSSECECYPWAWKNVKEWNDTLKVIEDSTKLYILGNENVTSKDFFPPLACDFYYYYAACENKNYAVGNVTFRPDPILNIGLVPLNKESLYVPKRYTMSSDKSWLLNLTNPQCINANTETFGDLSLQVAGSPAIDVSGKTTAANSSSSSNSSVKSLRSEGSTDPLVGEGSTESSTGSSTTTSVSSSTSTTTIDSFTLVPYVVKTKNTNCEMTSASEYRCNYCVFLPKSLHGIMTDSASSYMTSGSYYAGPWIYDGSYPSTLRLIGSNFAYNLFSEKKISQYNTFDEAGNRVGIPELGKYFGIPENSNFLSGSPIPGSVSKCSFELYYNYNVNPVKEYDTQFYLFWADSPNSIKSYLGTLSKVSSYAPEYTFSK